MLRKIERDPADAPLTSAAVRALERARKIRGKVLLEDSRQKYSAIPAAVEQPAPPKLEGVERKGYAYEENGHAPQPSETPASAEATQAPNGSKPPKRTKKEKPDPYANRKPISEVLHDIYDKNVQ